MTEGFSFAEYIPLDVQEKLMHGRPEPKHRVEGTAFEWNDGTAFYEPHERELMRSLKAGGHVDELALVHELKATFGGSRIEDE